MGYSEGNDVTWHVKKVQVLTPKGVKKEFWMEDWLRAGPINMLFPKVAKDAQDVDYDVRITTSSSRGAGADGDVYITFVGDLVSPLRRLVFLLTTRRALVAGVAPTVACRSLPRCLQGASPEVLVRPSMIVQNDSTSPDQLFARSTTTRLKVPGADVGDLSHVTLRLAPPNAGQLHASWSVDDVKVVHPGTGMASMFYLYDWITAAEPRITISEGCTWMERSQFTVTTYTSSLPGADFEGAVHLVLNGAWGSSGEVQLLAPKAAKRSHNFKTGAADAFKLMVEDQSMLQSISLRLEPTSDDNLTWHLDKVRRGLLCCGTRSPPGGIVRATRASTWSGGRAIAGGGAERVVRRGGHVPPRQLDQRRHHRDAVQGHAPGRVRGAPRHVGRVAQRRRLHRRRVRHCARPVRQQRRGAARQRQRRRRQREPHRLHAGRPAGKRRPRCDERHPRRLPVACKRRAASHTPRQRCCCCCRCCAASPTQEFEIRTRDVGSLTKLTLRVAASSKLPATASWKLDRVQVQVKDPAAKENTFTSEAPLEVTAESGGTLDLPRLFNLVRATRSPPPATSADPAGARPSRMLARPPARWVGVLRVLRVRVSAGRVQGDGRDVQRAVRRGL